MKASAFAVLIFLKGRRGAGSLSRGDGVVEKGHYSPNGRGAPHSLGFFELQTFSKKEKKEFLCTARRTRQRDCLYTRNKATHL